MTEEKEIKRQETISFEEVSMYMREGDPNALLGIGILIGACGLGVNIGTDSDKELFSNKQITITQYEDETIKYEVTDIE